MEASSFFNTGYFERNIRILILKHTLDRLKWFDSLIFFKSSRCFTTIFIILLFRFFKSSSNFSTTSLGPLAFLTASFSPVSSVLSVFTIESRSSPLISLIWSDNFFFWLSRLRWKSIVFQFLVCDGKTHQAIKYDKHANKKHNKKIKHKKPF